MSNTPNTKRSQRIGTFTLEKYDLRRVTELFDEPLPEYVWETALAKTPELVEWLETYASSRYHFTTRGIGSVAIILRGPKPIYLQMESEQDVLLLHLTMGDSLIPKEWINR
jgi:hypothetical protein